MRLFNLDLLAFLWSSVKSIFVAAVLLFLALFVLPESLTVKLIKVMKPSLLKRNNNFYMGLISLILKNDYTSYLETNEIDNKLERIKDLKNELGDLESKIFIMDSLNGIFDMLIYIVGCNVFETELFETTSSYFMFYCRDLHQKSGKELGNDIQNKFSEFQEKLEEIDDANKILNEEKDIRNRYNKIHSAQLKEALSFKDYLNQKNSDFLKNRENKQRELLKLVKLTLEEK